MAKMERRLSAEGYETFNLAYPSTRYTIDRLADEFVLPAIVARFGSRNEPIRFVTHSMGGIIVRALARRKTGFSFGRVVMLSPPNQGSQVVDALGNLRLFKILNGPAGRELGTGKESQPKRLGPATFELGIITGDRSINLFLSTLISGPNDGKVSVENAKLEGMRDFIIVHAVHPLIMKNNLAIAQTLHFLEYGVFKHAERSPGIPKNNPD